MKNLTKVLIVVLCLALLAVAAVSCGTPKETTGGDDTSTNAPETTGTPDETQPDETQPDETQPDETQPDETQPDETQPDETQPDETQPDETQPDETQPDETQPDAGTDPVVPMENVAKLVFDGSEEFKDDGNYTFVRGSDMSFSYRNDKEGFTIADGKWLVSTYTGTGGTAMLDGSANGALFELLQGRSEGKVVTAFDLSFEISYEGTLPSMPDAAGDKIFVGLRETIHAGQNRLELTGSMVGDKIALNGNVLEKSTVYTVTMSFDALANKIVVTMKSAGAEAVTLAETVCPEIFTNFQRIVFRCGTSGPFYCENASTFALYIDNFSIDYVG